MQTFKEKHYLVELDEYYCENCAPETAKEVNIAGEDPEYCNNCGKNLWSKDHFVDLKDLIDEFKQKRTSNFWVGYKGVGNLERILRVMGYTSVEKFLANNPDFIHLIINGITDTDEPIWIDDFKKELGYE